MRALIGQLGANGDCLYATTLARQIKADFPECELTWAVASACAHILVNNPHVDDVWVWKVDDWANLSTAWAALERQCLSGRLSGRDFDRIWLSQIVPSNIRHFDGTVRPSILRAYAREITVPVDSVIALADDEIATVDEFVREKKILDYEHRILFECSAKSGQSYVTPDFALGVAEAVSKELDNTCFVLSTHEDVKTDLSNVISAKAVGMRENAALTHHCSMFVGCGSGLTVVATSSASKTLPNIQLLRGNTSVYASFCHDFEYWGKPSERFIEMADAPIERVAQVILAVCRDGAEAARDRYHRPIPVSFDKYLKFVERWGIGMGRYVDALESLAITCERYGRQPKLLSFARTRIVPRLYWDPVAMDTRQSNRIDQILEQFDVGVSPRLPRRY